MNKTLIIILLLFVFVGGGAFLLNTQSENNKTSSNAPAMERIKSKNSTSVKSTLDNNSKYIEYSKEAMARAAGARRVLFFYASWCPICIPADKDFRENMNKFPDDLVLIRVNYNDPDTDADEKELAKKYGVTYQHTFVQIDGEGNEVTKWNGGQTEELLENIQ